jgi:hypothetical protein
MRDGTGAGRFVAINVLESFCEVNRQFGSDALRIVREMVPQLAGDGDALSHLLICGAGIVEMDIEPRWQLLVPSLDEAFELVEERGADAMLTFGREMRSMAFFIDGRIGTNFMHYLLAAGYLAEGSAWREAALEFGAAMLARHPAEIGRLFAAYNIAEKTMVEAEARKTQGVLDQQRTFGTRARWNSFFVKALARDTKLRYFLIKYMFGSVALCNNVTEWATQMGTFMIEAVRAYAFPEGDAVTYAHLSVEDVYASSPFRPKPGGGERYVPRRKAASKTRKKR